MAADKRGGLEPVDVRHVDIEQDDRKGTLEDLLESLGARMRLDDLRVDIAQQRRVDQQLLWQVIDDEDAGAAHDGVQRTTRRGRALRLIPSAPLRTTSSNSACWASV